MSSPRYPSLYQINTRVRLAEISEELGRLATLDDVTDAELDRYAAAGFDFLWFLGVWQTGEAARRVSASNSMWVEEYHRVLPDFVESDVTGSCFAIREYKVHRDFGGDEALARLRARMKSRGLRLILDFVPNHMALDHPWVSRHPDWFVHGTDDLAKSQPQNYVHVGPQVLAYGRDPYFDGWPDTFQLNYGSNELQDAMLGELRRIARQCDGVRCDMAMLIMPEVFAKTWKISSRPFWPHATKVVRDDVAGFVFLAEVYWNLEWELQQQGFDYTYDKRLYDCLEDGDARQAREHLWAGLDFQDRLARFLENHDEPRAAATFSPGAHRAAAVVTYFTPGLRFLHQGQLEGKRVRIPVHLGRGPKEPVDVELTQFYKQLLSCLKDATFRGGNWQLLDRWSAWDGNATNDHFIVFTWTAGDARRLVVVNYSGQQSQCYAMLPWADVFGKTLRLTDRMGSAVYDRDGDDLATRGLYLDLPPWGYHVFDVTEI